METAPKQMEQAVALLEYCYDEHAPARLRSYLILYAACKINELWKSLRFRELLGKHNELATGIIGVMMEGPSK